MDIALLYALGTAMNAAAIAAWLTGRLETDPPALIALSFVLLGICAAHLRKEWPGRESERR